MNIPLITISYLAAAISFVFLGLSLLASWRGKYRGILLTLACFVTSVWAGLNAFSGYNAHMTIPIAVMEVIRSAVWLLFIWEVLLGAKTSTVCSLFNAFIVGLISVPLMIFTMYIHAGGRGQSQVLLLFDITSHVVLAIFGMVLIEQLFRNTQADSRWGIKFICMGIGAMFVYDFFLYSDAMLFHQIDQNIWMARGVVNAIISPLIMVSAVRNQQWSLSVHMSRNLVFHTTTLLGAGVYLLLMAATGYYLRIFGGSWGGVLQVAFLFGASIVLLTVFFSGSIRSKLRVLLSKHFFSYKYDYREEWLRFTRTLLTSEPNGQIYQAAIKAIAVLVESPSGLLWMVQEPGGDYACVAGWNMVIPELVVHAKDSLVVFMAESQRVINIDEYLPNRTLYGRLEIPDWLSGIMNAWILVPLMLQERLMGFIILAQSRSDIQLNWEVSDLLKAAAHQLANNLAQKLATDALLVARQFDSFNRMSAFVAHDLKNLVGQLSLMLSNAKKHKNNPEFQEDMLSTLQNSVDKMNRLLLQLRSGNPSESPKTEVAVFELLQSVHEAKANLKPLPTLEADDENIFVIADKEKLSRVIGHIIQNACEATHYDGKVDVRLSGRDGFAVIEVKDDGKGMDDAFIHDRLFRPFDSTKCAGMGIGAYECHEYIRELGGFVKVSSAPEKGTLFCIAIPLFDKICPAGIAS